MPRRRPPSSRRRHRPAGGFAANALGKLTTMANPPPRAVSFPGRIAADRRRVAQKMRARYQ